MPFAFPVALAASQYLFTELATALDRGKQILPILAEPDATVPPILAPLQYLDLSEESSRQARLDAFVKHLTAERNKHDEIALGTASLENQLNNLKILQENALYCARLKRKPTVKLAAFAIALAAVASTVAVTIVVTQAANPVSIVWIVSAVGAFLISSLSFIVGRLTSRNQPPDLWTRHSDKVYH